MNLTQIEAFLESYGGVNWRDLAILGFQALLVAGFGIVILSLLWRAWR